MTIKGAWLASQQGTVPYASALKQGTGWNPIHASMDNGTGRATAPDGTVNGADPTILGDFTVDDFGYCDEDSTNILYGYGVQTGTSDRPDWGEPAGYSRSGVMEGYPSWGKPKVGGMRGAFIRSIRRGQEIGLRSKVIPSEPAVEGLLNKQHGEVENAQVSDPAQYIMQTSMVQRDKTRAGSQRSGSQSDFDAPIESRITGQKLRYWPEGERNYDMEPKVQDQMLRPFWSRTAGTGNVDDMLPNEMYVSEPMQWIPADSPNPGPEVSANVYGYMSEDSLY